MRKVFTLAILGILMLSLLSIGPVDQPVQASSHREAPSTSVDPMADNTDVYAFVDPNEPTRVNLIANFIPFQLPQGGPNFYRFDDNVLYEIRIDNNGDAVTDISLQFRFRTDVRNPNTFLYNTGPVTSIGDLDLNIRQFYEVTVVRNPGQAGSTSQVIARNVRVPPVNIGPRSTPNYENVLARAAVTNVNTSLGDRVTLFAGQRDECFYFDLGSGFDLFGLRPFNSAHKIPRPDTAGVDATAGFSVSTIAVQVPISALTADGSTPTDPNNPNAVIGVYAAASRRAMIAFSEDRSGGVTFSGNFVQVSRLGNPLVNELLIPLGMKDRFNASLPGQDAQFLSFVLDPEPGRLFGYTDSPPAFDLYPSFNAPAPPRNDVATVFLTGIPGLNQQPTANPQPFPDQPASVVPNERMRLNVAIPPSGPANTAGTPDRLGLLSPTPAGNCPPSGVPGQPFGDCAGFPNGRRPGDDVVDIELRVLAGATPFTPDFNVAPNNQLGDGANENDVPFLTRFPYLSTPRAGYDAPGGRDGTTDTNAPANPPPAPTPRP